MRVIPVPDRGDLRIHAPLASPKALHEITKRGPIFGCRFRRREAPERRELEAAFLEMVNRATGGRRSYAGQELKHPKRCHGIPGVFRPAEDADGVLDVRSLEKFEATIFDVGDIASRQLKLQRGAVVR